MPDYQITDSTNLRQRIGVIDMKLSKLNTSVARVDSEIDDLRSAIKSLNGIVASMRVVVSDLRRCDIPDDVWNGTAPDPAIRR